MTTRAEVARRRIIESGSPLAKHSLSQRILKREEDRRSAVLGKPNSKGEKARAGRRRTIEFIEQLPRRQFDRALGHMMDGRPTIEDISYVVGHVSDYERPIGNNGFEITVVDFTRTEIEQQFSY